MSVRWSPCAPPPTVFVRSHHAVAILVGSIDRRVVPAIRLAQHLRCDEIRAVHVAEDNEIAHELGLRWMKFGLAWLSLHVVEPTTTTLVDSVRAAVLDILDAGYREVTVLIPHLAVSSLWQRLLHRQRGRHIAAALAATPAINVILVPHHLRREGATDEMRE
jgi:hypothetical protein